MNILDTRPIPRLHMMCTFLLLASASVNISNAQVYKEEDLNFVYDGNEIFGKLILPVSRSDQKLPVVVFVHGSGPEDYSSSDSYRYLWEEFTKVGFACFSWDRPGVGQSQGKWFEMSVRDRADEVLGAISVLKKSERIDSAKIGLWGLSQAGWVMPLVSETMKPAFLITVSSPVTNAFEQELYRVKAGMTAEGYSDADIDQALVYYKKLKDLIDQDESYEMFSLLQEEIRGAEWATQVITGEEVVYRYLSIVLSADEAPNLGALKCPVLAIWGENDLVVPPTKSLETYQRELETIGNSNVMLKLIPEADHTLTYNLSGKSSETLKRRDTYKDNPEEIFAPGYVDLMTEWLGTLYRP